MKKILKKKKIISRKSKPNHINWKVFITSLIIVFIIAGLGSMFTKIDSWYDSIKPSIAPPNFVFPVVWTFLFYLIAISMYFSWISSNKYEKKQIIRLYGINFLLNILWSLVFFTAKSPFGAFVVLIMLWFSILHLIIFNWKINKKASYVLMPYLLWVSFAGILNYLIVVS